MRVILFVLLLVAGCAPCDGRASDDFCDAYYRAFQAGYCNEMIRYTQSGCVPPTYEARCWEGRFEEKMEAMYKGVDDGAEAARSAVEERREPNFWETEDQGVTR
jgi:hypothetical protein